MENFNSASKQPSKVLISFNSGTLTAITRLDTTRLSQAKAQQHLCPRPRNWFKAPPQPKWYCWWCPRITTESDGVTLGIASNWAATTQNHCS